MIPCHWGSQSSSSFPPHCPHTPEHERHWESCSQITTGDCVYKAGRNQGHLAVQVCFRGTWHTEASLGRQQPSSWHNLRHPLLMLAPGWFTPSPLIPQGISPALTRCSAFHMDHLTKDTKNVTLGIKAGTQAAIWWPWQPQSKMNLPYSVYGRAGGLQELVDQISPPSLFLVLKPFPDRIELKEAAGLLFLKEERRRMKVFGNQFRRVWIQLDKVSCLSLAIFKFIFLSPMLLRFYCCEDSGTETESQ